MTPDLRSIPPFARPLFESEPARSPSDDEPERDESPAPATGQPPPGTPPGASFTLGAWVAPFLLLAMIMGCATPKRGQFCAQWCDPLDLLAVYSDGTCVCSVGGSLGRAPRLDPTGIGTATLQPVDRRGMRDLARETAKEIRP